MGTFSSKRRRKEELYLFERKKKIRLQDGRSSVTST